MTAVPAEEVVEPALEITDPHHHLWDTHQPPYVLDDLLADAGDGHNVTNTIYVECGWMVDPAADPSRFAPVGEVEHVAGLAEESERRGGTRLAKIIGHADLRYGDSIADVLDRLAEVGAGRLAGIRQCVTWDASDEVSTHPSEPAPHLLADPVFRRGFGQLNGRSFTFDVWAYHPQLPDLVDLVRDFPDVRVIVDHFGGPVKIGPYAANPADEGAAWRRSMTELSRCDNVVVKLGGIGMAALAGPSPAPASSTALAERWGPDLRWCIETFGADRCMFESNFPVDRRMYPYRVLWNAFKRIVADASPAEKTALFRGTATAVYGLDADQVTSERV